MYHFKVFSRSKGHEVVEAETISEVQKQFEALIQRGYVAVADYGKERGKEVVSTFDPDAEDTYLMPAISGG